MMIDERTKELYLDYIEGKLSKQQRVVCETQMLEDARLRNLVAHMIRDRNRIRSLADEPTPLDLMQRVHERLEREMLLGPPTGNAVSTVSVHRRRGRVLRLAFVSSLAAMILMAAAVVFDSLTPSPLIQDWIAFTRTKIEDPRSVAQLTRPDPAKLVATADQDALDQSATALSDTADEYATERRRSEQPQLGRQVMPELDHDGSEAVGQSGVEVDLQRRVDGRADRPMPSRSAVDGPSREAEADAVSEESIIDPPSASQPDEAFRGARLRGGAGQREPSEQLRGLFESDAVGRDAPEPEAAAAAPASTPPPMPPSPLAPQGEMRKILDGSTTVTRLEIIADEPRAARQSVLAWAQQHEAAIIAGGDDQTRPLVLKVPAGQISRLLRDMNEAAGQAATLHIEPATASAQVPARPAAAARQAADGKPPEAAPDAPPEARPQAPAETPPFIHWWGYLAAELPMPPALRLHLSDTPVEVTVTVSPAAEAIDDDEMIDDF